MPRQAKPWKWRGKWYTDAGGRRRCLGSDYDEATKALHSLLSAPPKDRHVRSLASLCELFLDWVLANRAPRTYEWYRGRLVSLCREIGPIAQESLRPYHVERVFAAHPKWAPGYRAGIARCIRRVYSWGVTQGLVDRSPVAGLRSPRPVSRDVRLTAEDLREALVGARSEFDDIVWFVWHTGARPQEARIVELRHLDLHDRLVLPATEAKGKRPRVIYLSEEALAIVHRACEQAPDGPMFRNAWGRPWTATAISCAWARQAERTGYRIRMYDLRHAYATRKLRAGTDVLTVAHLLGHADPSMLAQVYSHVQLDVEFMQQAVRGD